MTKYDDQYSSLLNSIIDTGTWVENERTGVRCLTGNTAIFEYDVSGGILPIITTRKAYYKSAIAELIGYWQGLTDAQDFANLGSPTWFANANQNKDWLRSRFRSRSNHMGKVYGAIGYDFGGVNQFEKVVNDLRQGLDDRGEIITYWKPDEFDKGCLRPCMHSFQYTILDGVLNMTAIQRSCDVPLGLVANMMQVYCSLEFMASITGLKAGKATHIIHHPHIYENQYDDAVIQAKRVGLDCEPKLVYTGVECWSDILNINNMDRFAILDYDHHDPIKYAFTE